MAGILNGKLAYRINLNYLRDEIPEMMTRGRAQAPHRKTLQQFGICAPRRVTHEHGG
jgi:hypothetical protein